MVNGGMNRKDLLRLLAERMEQRGVVGELFIVGGSAMALAYDARRTTVDIDAVIHPRDVLLDIAHQIAADFGLSPNWLNDAVSVYLPNAEDAKPRRLAEFGPLRVSIGSSEFLLAMKAMVSRKSPGDLDDAVTLARILGVSREGQIEEIVHRYFGSGTLGAQELWIEDIIDAVKQHRTFEP